MLTNLIKIYYVIKDYKICGYKLRKKIENEPTVSEISTGTVFICISAVKIRPLKIFFVQDRFFATFAMI